MQRHPLPCSRVNCSGVKWFETPGVSSSRKAAFRTTPWHPPRTACKIMVRVLPGSAITLFWSFRVVHDKFLTISFDRFVVIADRDCLFEFTDCSFFECSG